MDLGLDQAIPCGLALNELITNALKHAFPEQRKGTVKLVLRLKDGMVHLRVEDDGVGMPEGFDVARDANLGLELVSTLMEQLDGAFTVEHGNGARYLLTFGLIQ